MKKTYLLNGFVAMAMGLAAVGCSHDADYSNAGRKNQAVADYNKAFVKVFGEPAEDQDWGFGTTTKSGTRGSNAGDGYIGNTTWEKFNADELVNIEDAERKAVLAAIAKKVTGEKMSEDIVFPWKNYYLQDVVNFTSDYSGDDFANAGKKGMNDVSVSNLEAFDKGGDCSPYYRHGDDYANYVEVTNSKQMNQYFQKQTPNGQQERIDKTTLMVDMTVGTYEEMKGRQFRVYQNCHIGGHYDDYITVQVNGSWYICFDFGCGDADHDVDGNPGRGATYNDWDYNDWIIKITEAVPHGGQNTPVWGDTPQDPNWEFQCRVFAEDLSATEASDFDFNDVVFDVYHHKTEKKTKIQLLAAGGTLPLTVAGYDVKEQFGVPTSTIVNTGEDIGVVNGLKADSIVLDSIVQPVDIVIAVSKGGPMSPLEAHKGEPASKFAVPKQIDWAPEYHNIRKKYPKFDGWVGDPSVKWYE